jgi:hypothetical protein
MRSAFVLNIMSLTSIQHAVSSQRYNGIDEEDAPSLPISLPNLRVRVQYPTCKSQLTV